MVKYRFEDRIDEIYDLLGRAQSLDDILRAKRKISALYRDINRVRDDIKDTIVKNSMNRIIGGLNKVKERVIDETLTRYASKIPQFGEDELFDRLVEFYHRHLVVKYDIDTKTVSIRKVSVKPDVDAYSSGMKWMRVTKKAREDYYERLLFLKIDNFRTKLKGNTRELYKIIERLEKKYKAKTRNPDVGKKRSENWAKIYKSHGDRYKIVMLERLDLLPKFGKYSAPYWYFVEYGSVRMPGSYPGSFPTPVNEPVRLTASIRSKLAVEARKEMETLREIALKSVSNFEEALTSLHSENLSVKSLESFDKSYKRLRTLIKEVGKRAVKYV